MSDRIHPVSIEDAAEQIRGKSALIICHVNPDGDALGSATALRELMVLSGGSGRIVTPSPVPERLSFITGDIDTSYTDGMEKDFDLVLTVDCASPNQLGHLSCLADKVDISFDHHENCTLYSPHVLYAGAPAAALVIFDLFLHMSESYMLAGDPSGLLRRVYAGLSSDTGSFKYANATPDAFAAAAEICHRLREAPVSDGAPIDKMAPSDISAALFDCVTMKDVEVRRIAYKNLRYICGGNIAVSFATHAEMKAAGLSIDDLGGMVDSVRAIGSTAVGIVLKESAKGIWRGSSRANVDFDVSVPAALLGGGGHKRAAGFTVEAMTAAEAVEITERVFGEALQKEGIHG